MTNHKINGIPWAYVIPHFTQFLANLELTSKQRGDAIKKVQSVGKCLHAKYYAGDYTGDSVVVVGSYGKGTATRPPSDIDMLYILPHDEYNRIDSLTGNRQSRLLQEIRETLVKSFPRTEISADGQVVKVSFSSYFIEVVPAFLCSDRTYLICHTANGGSWRASNPIAEYRAIADVDAAYQVKATHLIKMLKAWKRNCNVPLKSIALEIAASSFIRQWQHNDQSILWYDWMIRDFFRFLWHHKNGTAQIPGIQEIICLGDSWASRCKSAYLRAVKACEYEYHNDGILAEREWKKIFGDQFTRATSGGEVVYDHNRQHGSFSEVLEFSARAIW